MARQDTRLEAEGAEFLVFGHLLVEGLQAYIMYRNMPGYDILAVNPESHREARISVKSRWRASANGFIIKNFYSDFVVVVKLNRGLAELKQPDFFIIPTGKLEPLKVPGWGKLNFSAIPNFQSYLGAWDQIRDFLHLAPPPEPIEEDEDEP
jgi:hypothetical protein